MTWGRKPIFNPLSTTNFIRLCHFTRVRLWTVYNPNRSMLGLMLANALDLVYTCLDQIFNGRIFHRCDWFTRNCANSVPDCSILCRSKAGPARVIERWIFSSFCPFKDLPGPVYMRSWKELYMERQKKIFVIYLRITPTQSVKVKCIKYSLCQEKSSLCTEGIGMGCLCTGYIK